LVQTFKSIRGGGREEAGDAQTHIEKIEIEQDYFRRVG
jgi:hypothetical protein